MSDYYVYKLPKSMNGNDKPDKAGVTELEALAEAVSGSQKKIYLSGPHDTPEQKAVIKAVRTYLMGKGVPADQITTTKPAGEPAAMISGASTR
jgi:hypothetical protein